MVDSPNIAQYWHRGNLACSLLLCSFQGLRIAVDRLPQITASECPSFITDSILFPSRLFRPKTVLSFVCSDRFRSGAFFFLCYVGALKSFLSFFLFSFLLFVFFLVLVSCELFSSFHSAKPLSPPVESIELILGIGGVPALLFLCQLVNYRSASARGDWGCGSFISSTKFWHRSRNVFFRFLCYFFYEFIRFS